MEKGEKVLFLEPHWKTMTETLTAWSLKSHQYVRLQVRPYNILHVQDPCFNDSEGRRESCCVLQPCVCVALLRTQQQATSELRRDAS